MSDGVPLRAWLLVAASLLLVLLGYRSARAQLDAMRGELSALRRSVGDESADVRTAIGDLRSLLSKQRAALDEAVSRGGPAGQAAQAAGGQGAAAKAPAGGASNLLLQARLDKLEKALQASALSRSASRRRAAPSAFRAVAFVARLSLSFL